MLLYFGAALALLQSLVSAALYWDVLFEIVGNAAGAYGTANERRWGYVIAVLSALFPFLLRLVFYLNPFAHFGLLQLAFAILLLFLLFHPQSREYERIWFK